MSRSVLACRMWSSRPRRGPPPAGLSLGSAAERLAGLTRTAMTSPWGPAHAAARAASAPAPRSMRSRRSCCRPAGSGWRQDQPRPGRRRNEDDGDRRGRRLGCQRRSISAGRTITVDLAANQIGRQCRQPIVLVRPPSDIRSPRSALNVAGFAQTLAKRAHSGPRVRSGDAPLRNPITGIAGCCARAASGHAAAPPSSVMNSRRFIRSPRRRGRAASAARRGRAPWRS